MMRLKRRSDYGPCEMPTKVDTTVPFPVVRVTNVSAKEDE